MTLVGGCCVHGGSRPRSASGGPASSTTTGGVFLAPHPTLAVGCRLPLGARPVRVTGMSEVLRRGQPGLKVGAPLLAASHIGRPAPVAAAGRGREASPVDRASEFWGGSDDDRPSEAPPEDTSRSLSPALAAARDEVCAVDGVLRSVLPVTETAPTFPHRSPRKPSTLLTPSVYAVGS